MKGSHFPGDVRIMDSFGRLNDSTMKLILMVWLIAVFPILTGCHSASSHKNDFYSYQKESDLWRFPLLQPYELISPTNSNDWFLVLNNPRFDNPDHFNQEGEFQLSYIDSVAVVNNVIVVSSSGQYWPKLSGTYETTVVIDTKGKRSFIYSNQHHGKAMQDKLKELNAGVIRLYPLDSLVKQFQAELTLPGEWLR